MIRGAIARAALLFLASCGPELGILEIAILAPPRVAEGPRYVFVQARSSDYDFDVDWARRNDVEGFLLADAPQRFELSVGSTREVDAARVRARFCHSPRCDADPRDDLAPEARFELPRPFCAGEHTELELALPDVPTGVTFRAIEPCAICGCEERRSLLECPASCEASAPPAPDGGG